jgi:hypothetical protein
MKKALIVLGCIVVVVVACSIVWIVRPPPKPLPIPSPNGYDDFVAAASAVVGDPSKFNTLDESTLAAFVAGNANVFDRVEAGLQKESRVPPVRSMKELPTRMREIGNFKPLALTLTARARLARMQGRFAEAADAGLDGIELSHDVARGGVVIDVMVSLYMEGISRREFSSLISQLDAKTARDSLQRLIQMNTNVVTFSEILAEERAFSRSQGAMGGFMVAADQYFGIGPLKATRVALEKKCAAMETERRLLLVKVASRLYELEKGSAPAKESDLIPDYLPQ